MRPDTTPFSLIAEWLPVQRWFAGKTALPLLRRIGGWDLPGGGVGIHTHLLMDESGRTPVLYQVPVTERTEPLAGAEGALVGIYHPEPGRPVYVYDAPHDPAYARALLRMIMLGTSATPDGAGAAGVAFGTGSPREVASSAVLTGEQSNTSIIYELAGPGPAERVICKVFRTLHHGENPDVVLQGALAAAGSPVVPQPVGAVVGEWDDVGEATGRATGHLAFAQEFIFGAEDGWRIALRAAAAGTDFTGPARALGVLTAEMHAVLASVLPTREPADGDIDSAIESWQRRLDLAADEVPSVAEYRQWVEAVYRETRNHDWPRVQRIHGDFHLGQVLATPAGRWIALDFEGEPMRPMIERGRLDYALRDVAGMLRSFEYAAASGAMNAAAVSPAGRDAPADDTAPATWAAACRRAFLDGYVERSGVDLRRHHALLDAFELDKVLYEAVYEARNRPEWLPIPITALAHFAERSHTEGPETGRTRAEHERPEENASR
ncbi:maltokinase N-terminal cap-like domain-containing protein [Glaciibacter sp. 2TAF33]|uniref:maltokinase N-terminal cap-like domain-containing protein n=1 Tax=Glaciibacter sp. 2TAF33 TaxID=3233015 RepID=UPI003F8EBC4D